MNHVQFDIPGSFPSVANLREHWAAKARRVKKQRFDAAHLTLVNTGLPLQADLIAFGGAVMLIRCAPRQLDSDNLAGSLKAVRDGIASALGINDGDSRISWVYGQEKCRDGEQHVNVRVGAARPR